MYLISMKLLQILIRSFSDFSGNAILMYDTDCEVNICDGNFSMGNKGRLKPQLYSIADFSPYQQIKNKIENYGFNSKYVRKC